MLLDGGRGVWDGGYATGRRFAGGAGAAGREVCACGAGVFSGVEDFGDMVATVIAAPVAALTAAMRAKVVFDILAIAWGTQCEFIKVRKI